MKKSKVKKTKLLYLFFGLIVFSIAVFLVRASLFSTVMFHFKAANYLELIFFAAISTGIILLLTKLAAWFLRAETKK